MNRKLFFFGGLDSIFLVEALDASCGVDEFLLSGKERMAGGTNFNLNVLYRRTGLDDIATCAGDGGELIFGVDSLFHFFLRTRQVVSASENRPK